MSSASKGCDTLLLMARRVDWYGWKFAGCRRETCYTQVSMANPTLDMFELQERGMGRVIIDCDRMQIVCGLHDLLLLRNGFAVSLPPADVARWTGIARAHTLLCNSKGEGDYFGVYGQMGGCGHTHLLIEGYGPTEVCPTHLKASQVCRQYLAFVRSWGRR